MYGGATVVANDLRVIYSGAFLPDYHVALVDTLDRRPDFEGPERESELMDAFIQDADYRYIKSYKILMDLIPALYENDSDRIGKLLWPFQFGGCHNSMLSDYVDYGAEIVRTMTFFKRNGIHLVGMSSVGPTVYAIYKEKEKLIETCEKLDKPYTISKVENQCLKI